jgi:hypothetical protein
MSRVIGYQGKDRTSLLLPGTQHALITQVAAAAAARHKPVALVVMSGGVVDISASKSNPDIGSIL